MRSLAATSASDHALILLDQPVNDAETESLVPIAFRALHRLEKIPQNVRWYPGPVVSDAEFHEQRTILVDVAVVDNLDFAARTHGFHGVLDQIDQYLFQRVGVGLGFHWQVLRMDQDLHRIRGKLGIAEQTGDITHDTINFRSVLADSRLQIREPLNDDSYPVNLFIENGDFSEYGFLPFQFAIENAQVILDDR